MLHLAIVLAICYGWEIALPGNDRWMAWSIGAELSQAAEQASWATQHYNHHTMVAISFHLRSQGSYILRGPSHLCQEGGEVSPDNKWQISHASINSCRFSGSYYSVMDSIPYSWKSLTQLTISILYRENINQSNIAYYVHWCCTPHQCNLNIKVDDNPITVNCSFTIIILFP